MTFFIIYILGCIASYLTEKYHKRNFWSNSTRISAIMHAFWSWFSAFINILYILNDE